jgi:hypothetical protein
MNERKSVEIDTNHSASVEEEPLQLSPAQCEELDRRRAEGDACGDRGITWAELKERVTRRV